MHTSCRLTVSAQIVRRHHQHPRRTEDIKRGTTSGEKKGASFCSEERAPTGGKWWHDWRLRTGLLDKGCALQFYPRECASRHRRLGSRELKFFRGIQDQRTWLTPIGPAGFLLGTHCARIRLFDLSLHDYVEVEAWKPGDWGRNVEFGLDEPCVLEHTKIGAQDRERGASESRIYRPVVSRCQINVRRA